MDGNCTYGAEGPATSTVALALDLCNDAFVSPIDGWGHGWRLNLFEGLNGEVPSGPGRVEESRELGWCQIGELVDSQIVALLASCVFFVVFFDGAQVVLEDGVPAVLFPEVPVFPAVVLL